MGTPLTRACEALTLLVESAVNCPISIPALLKLSLIHWPRVPGRALLNGFLEVRNTGLGESTVAAWSVVLERYNRSEVNGHTSVSSGNEE